MRPKKRSRLRIICGKHYYRMRRYLLWMTGKYHFARTHKLEELQYRITSHSTILLRKLKDVDMYLQYNKIENLKLAVKCIDGILIQPGETFMSHILRKRSNTI